MGFIAGFANAGSEAIDRRLNQIQQQEDTAYQLVAQRFLDNSTRRTEAKTADDARIRAAHTLAEQAGMPEAWTHAYDMLNAGLTPLQVSSKLDESTFSAFDPNSQEAQPVSPSDATASGSTQDVNEQPINLMGNTGANQPASNAVDVNNLTPIQNFINTGLGGVFNRANRTDSRMQQMSQRFANNMGIGMNEFNTVMGGPEQSQQMEHSGRLIPKLASGLSDYDGVIFVETTSPDGSFKTQEAFQNENGDFINPVTNEVIEGEITHVRTEEELDAINKLITLTNGQFQDIVDVQDGVSRGITSYMQLTGFLKDPNNANILTGTSGVLAFAESIGREADTLLDAFNAYGESETYTSAKDVENALINILPEDTRSMVGERAQFMSLMAGAAYELARAQNGSGVLSNRDIAAAFDQIRGNTTNPAIFIQNLQNLAKKSISNANSAITSARRLPAIQQMEAQDVQAIQLVLKNMEEHLTQDQMDWIDLDYSSLSSQPTGADDQVPSDVDNMLTEESDEQDRNTVIRMYPDAGVKIHNRVDLGGGRSSIKFSVNDGEMFVVEVTREELNSPDLGQLLIQLHESQ